MRILLLTLSLSGTLTLYAQVDLTKRISIDVNHVRLDKLFEMLESQHGVIISFGIDNLPSDLTISLSAKDKSIYEILQMICTQAGLIYQIIDNAIVFKHARPTNVSRTGRGPDSSSISFTPNGDSTIQSQADSIAKVIVSIPTTAQPMDSSQDSLQSPDQTNYHKPKDSTHQVVNQFKDVELAPVPSLFSTAKKKSRVGLYGAGVFFSYAVDYNRFQFLDRDIAFQQYEVDWNHSLSTGGYVIVSSKLYVSLGVGYATKDFILNYHYRVLDPDDPFPIPDKTKVEIRYLEVPLTIGYGILNKRKYSLCIAAGFYPSYLIEKSERTTYLNNGNPSTSYFVNANRSTIYSGTIGFIAHYSIGNSCGIFIEPGYLYFIGAVNKNAMQANSSLYRIKTGIQFSLFRKK
ncbi:MAG: outer membrane beta-barrel protein [Cyclobacteriaceae bacterium]|nr:outer membrane beta-barrel protein [Cyclobacteriaceae bacterium]